MTFALPSPRAQHLTDTLILIGWFALFLLLLALDHHLDSLLPLVAE